MTRVGGRPTIGSTVRLGAGRRARAADWWLMSAVAALTATGTVLVWSATAHRWALPGADSAGYLTRHLINVVIGWLLMLTVMLTEHRWIRTAAPLSYLASILGLIAVLMAGTTINGSRSWLAIGAVSVQPAEFAKLTVVVAGAWWVAERGRDRWRPLRLSDVIGLLLIVALPVALILLQPDLGTVLVLATTSAGALAVAGIGRRWLIGLLATGILAVAAAVAFGVLRQYQVNRFLAFTDPGLDPQGAGYNTEQARIAIGNGGLAGQGLFDGSQTRSGFVPEQQTDFIFTVAGEELGLIGAGLLTVLIALVVWRALLIAVRADDAFGRIAAAGVGCWFGFQAFQNIGMCLGMMPVTGVPLPLVSYGGSSMFACLIAVGLLQNIRLRHHTKGLSLREERAVARVG
ncbi:MAG: rod shape-determining protein RodA [Nocardioides sp.]